MAGGAPASTDAGLPKWGSVEPLDKRVATVDEARELARDPEGCEIIAGEWYAREREKTSFRKCKNNVYGLVRAPLKDPESQEVIPGYDTSNPFSDEDLEVGETFLERRMLDPEVAATPAQSSFKIFASLGFADTGDYPLILGVGASYEFVSNNSGTDGVGIWGTFGLSF